MSTTVEKIKEKLTIEDVVTSYIKVERAGKNLKARCPFHNEKTPSFYISPDRGSYYCFGCGAKGDIFTFVEQFEGLDFMGAMKLLADRAGVPIVLEKPEHASEKERLYAIMEHATKFFEENLKNNKVAYDYIKSRGIKDETIKSFRIGYAQNDWRALYNHLKSKKYSDSDIEKAGLAKRKEPEYQDYKNNKPTNETTPYDRFRGRVMFPISDSSGRVIAFSGRIIVDDGKSAKYLNSPDTPLYTKSTVLYGIDKAKQDIRIKNYSIMVEGQMDLVLSHQAGVRNTVAVSGTALSDTIFSKENIVNNLGIVRRLSQNIILAFDSDSAGRKAALRSAKIALSIGMDVKIADLPDGKDPADLVRDDVEQWKNVLRKSKHVVEFELDAVMRDIEQAKLDSRKIPTAIRTHILPFIASISGAMEKSHFIKLISERTGLSESSITEDLIKIEKENQIKEKEESKTNISKKEEIKKNDLSHLDMVTRRLYGIIFYIEKNSLIDKDIDIKSQMDFIKNLVGEEKYKSLSDLHMLIKDDLLTEAEVLYSSNKSLKKEFDELILNFELDFTKQSFTKAMADLSQAERGKDDKKVEEISKKIQELTVRLNELSKRRK
jgi:DNA primase